MKCTQISSKQNLTNNKSNHSDVALCIKHGTNLAFMKFHSLLLFLSIHWYSVSIKNCLFQVIALYFYIWDVPVSYKISHNNRHKYSKHYGGIHKKTTTIYSREKYFGNVLQKRRLSQIKYWREKIISISFHGRASPPTLQIHHTLALLYKQLFWVKSDWYYTTEIYAKCLGVPNLKFDIRALLLQIQTEVLWVRSSEYHSILLNESMMTIMIIIIIINC